MIAPGPTLPARDLNVEGRCSCCVRSCAPNRSRLAPQLLAAGAAALVRNRTGRPTAERGVEPLV